MYNKGDPHSQSAERRSFLPRPCRRISPSLWQRFLLYLIPDSRRRFRMPRDRFLFGLAQPFVPGGLAVNRGFPDRFPKILALLLAGFCALAALLHQIEETESVKHLGFLRRFYATFAVLAPLPSILLSIPARSLRTQKRIVACAGDCTTDRTPLLQAAIHALKQALVIAISLAPLFGILKHFRGSEPRR